MKDIVAILGKYYQPLCILCPQLLTSFPHVKDIWPFPQNSQSLILLFKVQDVVIQISFKCPWGSLDAIPLVWFFSISEEL